MSEHTAQSPSRLKLWGSLLFLAVVIAGFGYLWRSVALWLDDEQRVPLRQIIITGERQYLSDEAVRQVVRQGQQDSLFELDIDATHRAIQSLPWVYQASVRKEWPDTLRVVIVEQRAVAKWQDDMLLNADGDSFHAQVPLALIDLPALFGPGGSEKTALAGYRAMEALLHGANLAIAELTLSERYAWQLRLANGINVNLGRTEFMSRLQRFVDIYPLLLRREKTVKYVDLRYDTGLAVGWEAAVKVP